MSDAAVLLNATPDTSTAQIDDLIITSTPTLMAVADEITNTPADSFPLSTPYRLTCPCSRGFGALSIVLRKEANDIAMDQQKTNDNILGYLNRVFHRLAYQCEMRDDIEVEYSRLQAFEVEARKEMGRLNNHVGELREHVRRLEEKVFLPPVETPEGIALLKERIRLLEQRVFPTCG